MVNATTDLLNTGPIHTLTLMSTAAVSLLLIWVIKSLSDSKRYPRGPWGFPILGHLPLFTSQPHLKLTKWADIFGSVYRIKMGSRLTIVINGYDAVKDALVNQSDDFAARPDFYSLQFIRDGKSLSFGKYGPQWKVHKSLARNALAMFTQKRVQQLESHVVDEADIITGELLASKESMDPKQSIHIAATSIVFSICFEEGLNIRENKRFLEVLRNLDDFSRIVGAGGNPIDAMPWTLPFLKWKMKSYISLMYSYDGINEVIQTELRETRTPHEPRNLSDALFDIIDEMGEAKLNESGLTSEQIASTAGDVIGAGQTTTVSFLTWALLYMVEFPEVQERVHAEIDREIGPNVCPRYEHRHRMPYCEAVVFETLRYSVALPFLLPHATTRDCTFHGFEIPEGALVFFNMYSVTRDERIWDDPHKFDPMRFIDPKTGLIDRNKTEQAIIFGMGKRRCLGEFLGRLESFIFFVRLLQRCKFSKVDGENYRIDGIFGLALDPHPYRVATELRG